jgi:hypothetical protein
VCVFVEATVRGDHEVHNGGIGGRDQQSLRGAFGCVLVCKDFNHRKDGAQLLCNLENGIIYRRKKMKKEIW